jgi:hypothetical protein
MAQLSISKNETYENYINIKPVEKTKAPETN